MKQSTVLENNKGISLAGERVLVSGGTQGIGAGVALRFAEAGAEAWIVGRNEAKANEVLTKLKAASAERKIDPAPEHRFLKADLSLVAESKRVAEEIRTLAGSRGIDYLVMTQGGPPNGTFKPTSENIDQHYGVQALSRFILAHMLSGDPESSVIKKGVMSIMAPGKGTDKVDVDDLYLRKAVTTGNFGILASLGRDSTVVDSFTADLAKANPNITFMHVFPGLVKTDFSRNSELPWYFSLGAAIAVKLASATTQQYAEVPFYLLANPEGRKQGAQDMFLDEKVIKVKPSSRFNDENSRAKIRSHLREILEMKS